MVRVNFKVSYKMEPDKLLVTTEDGEKDFERAGKQTNQQSTFSYNLYDKAKQHIFKIHFSGL